MSNPININGKNYINLEIKPKDSDPIDFQLTVDTFQKLDIVTECDNVLPMCSITFLRENYDILDVVSKAETTFIVTAADVSENVEEPMEFKITNFGINQNPDGKIIFTLHGIIKSDKYDKDVAIKPFNDMNSFEAIKQIMTEKPDIELDEEDLYQSEDMQTWLQHNCSIKEFVTRTLKNAFIEEGEAPISAINLDRKLRIVQIKKMFADKEPLFKLSNIEKDAIRYTNYTVATNRGILQKAFMDDRQQPVIDMHTKDKTQQTNTWWNSLLETFGMKIDENKPEVKPSGNYGDGIDYPILINCGNCHANYYFAYINNMKAKALLHSLDVVVQVDTKYFKDSELRILDIIEFIPVDEAQKPIKELSGKYMVTKKIVTFEDRKFSTKITLSRTLM